VETDLVLFCLCTLFIAITFTVLHIRVLWVDTEEPVDSEKMVVNLTTSRKVR